MASVDVLDDDFQREVSLTEDSPVWIYKPAAGCDEKLKDAAAVVSSDPQKYLLQDNVKKFEVLCLKEKDEDCEDGREEDGELLFDFKDQTIRLESASVKVPFLKPFCIKFIHHLNTDSAKRPLILMYQDGDKFQMFHVLVDDDELQPVLVINAFRRTLFEFYKQFTDTMDDVVTLINKCVPHYFDEMVLSISDRQNDEVLINNDKLFIVLGTFFLCVFKEPSSCHPLYTMYFWQVPDTMVVNNIVLINETGLVKIESQEYSIEIPNADKMYPEFVEAIKTMKPKSKTVFADPKKLVSSFSQKIQSKTTPWKMPKTETSWDYYGGTDQHAETRQRIKSFRGTDQHAETRERIKSFRNNLNVALSTFSENEQISLPWIMAETELKNLIDAGFVPETDIASGGLDPNSMDHFLQCIRQIEEHLTTQQYDLALSRLRGTGLIYTESDIEEMKALFADDDVTLMKKIYFHSFLN